MDDPRPRSHFLPRSRDGWVATTLFVVIFSLAMPPFTHAILDRADPRVFGLPFLYVALLAVYTVLIGVLVWALRRKV